MKSLIVNMENFDFNGDVLDIALSGNAAISELINSFVGSSDFNIEKDYMTWDKKNISRSDGVYDYAFAFFSLSNIIGNIRLIRMMKEINRVLKTDGKLLIWDVHSSRIRLSNELNLKVILPQKRSINIPVKMYFNPLRIGYNSTLKIINNCNFKILNTIIEDSMYFIEAAKIMEV